MSLLWMAIVTAIIFLQKVLPFGGRLTSALAAIFVGAGIWVAAAPGSVPGLVDPANAPAMQMGGSDGGSMQNDGMKGGSRQNEDTKSGSLRQKSGSMGGGGMKSGSMQNDGMKSGSMRGQGGSRQGSGMKDDGMQGR
jgi:hypothetical protein